MTFPAQNLAQAHTINKLNQLFGALQEVKKKYESFATSIKNQQLYQMVIGLATENNQYAAEIGSLIRSLGGQTEMPGSVEEETMLSKTPGNEKKVLDACEKNEIFLVKMYEDLLKESYVYDSLKRMISSQLNGILFSFHRLKLLNTFQK